MLKRLGRLLSGRKSPHAFVSQAEDQRQVVEALKALPDLGAQVEFLRQCKPYRVDQMQPEYTAFLSRVRELQPRRILEIGGRRGGSALMLSFAAPDAEIVSIDIDNSKRRLRRLQRLCEGRNVQFWRGDSQSEEMLNRVRTWMGEYSLDALFVDGDHQMKGAFTDFKSYVPLVRDGGIIALHDIQPDFKTRYDVSTLCWSGDIPSLWNKIRAAGFDCEELIADQWQDGYGIGVVTKRDDSGRCLADLAEQTKAA